MDFRRSGQLDERRRRVLMDEIASPTEDDSQDDSLDASAGSSKGPVRAYAPSVLSERQPRITDLVPTRPLLVCCWILLALTGVAAIEALHIHFAASPWKEGAEQLLALDVRQRGCLAAWYSSLLLAGATSAALIVFSIRAHRVDDYSGQYRVWLWSAAALGWLSLDAATGVHDAVGLALDLAAGKQLLHGTLAASCTATWLALYGLVLGTLLIRLAIEVWPSLPSFGALLISALLYLLSGLFRLHMLAVANPLVAVVLDSTITLVAHFLLATAVGLFARHVYLDADGRLKVHIDPDKKRSKSKRKGKLKVVKAERPSQPEAQPAKPNVSAAAKPAEPIRFGAPANPANPSAKAGAVISKASISSLEYDDDIDEDDDEYGGERLSKSERRRLKKLARQQRRAA